jgi:hypothetical protein
VTCDLGTVPGNGGFASVEIVAVPQVTGAITNSATVQLAETDPDLSDNSTSLLVDVVGGPMNDLRAVVVGASAGCSGNTKKRTCTMRGSPAFLYNDDRYFDSALDLTATCKKPGTTSESCQFKGTYAIRSLDLSGVPPHSVSVYLSNDTAWDAGDRALATATSAVLAQLAPKKKSLKISSKLPTGQGLSGKYILLRVDSGNAVAEDDEANNVAAIGPLP